MDEPTWLVGATYTCKVPDEMGRITKLEVKSGKLIARTESGVTMIVPTTTPTSPEA